MHKSMPFSLEKILLIRFAHHGYRRFPHNRTIPFALKHIEHWIKMYLKTQVMVLDQALDVSNDIEQVISRYNPSLVFCTGTLLEYRQIATCAKNMKEKNPSLLIVLAGQVSTGVPVSVLLSKTFFDIVLFGEFEEDAIHMFIALWNRVPASSILEERINIFLTRGPSCVENLDALLFPEWDTHTAQYRSIYPLPLNKRIQWGYMMTSRGCPRACIFCNPLIRKSYGQKMRYRSLENIEQEIEYLKKNKVDVIVFEDDNFTFSSGHVKNVCKVFLKKPYDIPWIAHAHVEEVSEEMLFLMKKAGCILIRVGVECASERLIQYLGKTHTGNWQQKTRHIFAYAKKIGIATHALFMIGSPTETPEEIEESIEYAKVLQPDMIQVHFFRSYTGFVQDQIDQTDISITDYYSAPDPGSSIDEKTLRKLFKRFYREFYLSPRFIRQSMYSYIPFFLKNPYVLREGIKGLLTI